MTSTVAFSKDKLMDEFDVLKYRLQYLNGLSIQAEALTFEDDIHKNHYCDTLNTYFNTVKTCYRTLHQLIETFDRQGQLPQQKALFLAYQQTQKDIKKTALKFVEVQPLRLNQDLDCQVWGVPQSHPQPTPKSKISVT